MEKLDKLGDWPPDVILYLTIISSVVGMIIINIIMGQFFTLSGFPRDQVITSELCFSGPYIKALYALMTNVSAFALAQGLDYIFMVTYGLFIFSMALFIARMFDEDSLYRKIGYIIAILGIVAALLDVMENLFIFLTLTDPINFPDWWAVAESAFSLPKWIIIGVAIIWALVSAILFAIKKARK